AYGEHYFLVALTVALSLVGVVLWGSIAGSILPFILRALGFDPASASAPFVATLVDVTGLIIYFTIAHVVFRCTLLLPISRGTFKFAAFPWSALRYTKALDRMDSMKSALQEKIVDKLAKIVTSEHVTTDKNRLDELSWDALSEGRLHPAKRPEVTLPFCSV